MVRPRVGHGVEVHVPATTANVGPGFDCLGAALDLDNVFQMRCIEGGSERFDLIIEGTEGAHLRGGPDNLVYRSAQRVWKEAGEEPVALEARVRLAVPPQVTAAGMPALDDEKILVDSIVEAVSAAVGKLDARGRAKDDAIDEAVRRAARRVATSLTGKKPVCHIHVLRLPAPGGRVAAGGARRKGEEA